MHHISNGGGGLHGLDVALLVPFFLTDARGPHTDYTLIHKITFLYHETKIIHIIPSKEKKKEKLT